MITPQQKQLEALVQTCISEHSSQAFHCQTQQILRLLTVRVDMPKHFITALSKKFASKQQQKLERIFDALWIVTEKYENKIALFNQISGNKEFLFKITSLLSLKDLRQDLKLKIIDLVYQWKQMFKPNKELFPNFWNFYVNFQKKGYTPSNLNFQTRYQQQSGQNTFISTQDKKPAEGNIFDLIEGNSSSQDFNSIEKHALLIFYNCLEKVVIQNVSFYFKKKIINNTNPDILDLPPILKQNMGSLKIFEDKINKYIAEHKNQATIDTSMSLIKAIQLTEKRYTQLVTKYLPQPFQLNPQLKSFEEFCKANSQNFKNAQIKTEIDLLNLDQPKSKTESTDLLDLDIGNNQGNNQTEQKSVKRFFGNLLDKVNGPKQQTVLSNQPIENNFKTDYDFIAYQDPKTLRQRIDIIQNSPPQDFFKF